VAQRPTTIVECVVGSLITLWYQRLAILLCGLGFPLESAFARAVQVGVDFVRRSFVAARENGIPILEALLRRFLTTESALQLLRAAPAHVPQIRLAGAVRIVVATRH
jgi:hypothetical protein